MGSWALNNDMGTETSRRARAYRLAREIFETIDLDRDTEIRMDDGVLTEDFRAFLDSTRIDLRNALDWSESILMSGLTQIRLMELGAILGAYEHALTDYKRVEDQPAGPCRGGISKEAIIQARMRKARHALDELRTLLPKEGA